MDTKRRRRKEHLRTDFLNAVLLLIFDPGSSSTSKGIEGNKEPFVNMPEEVSDNGDKLLLLRSLFPKNMKTLKLSVDCDVTTVVPHDSAALPHFLSVGSIPVLRGPLAPPVVYS